MVRYSSTFVVGFALFVSSAVAEEQLNERELLITYRAAGMKQGNPSRGKQVFESKKAACTKCHSIKGDQRRAGPDLMVIGDKYARNQLVRSVLEPSAMIHPDYGTVAVTANDGKVHLGVMLKRTNDELQLLDGEGELLQIPLGEIDSETRNPASLMPAGLFKTISADEFSDLVTYLETLKQEDALISSQGLVTEFEVIKKPIKLVPLHSAAIRFDHPVWIIAVPGTEHDYLVVEQQTRLVWRFTDGERKDRKQLFADLSGEAITGQFEGVMCLDFHPNFLENRKYYLNYHVREEGRFSPVIVERHATKDLQRDSGKPSRRLLRIVQSTDLHWGGMLAFGPDGYLYIGAGDGGPQEDPDGNGQNLSVFMGSILRIDADRTERNRPYAIPENNPYRNSGENVLPEIWASGFRMPWRFSFDPVTNDLWVGDIGQNLFEEVSIARIGENHGWNVYEGFSEFSEQYRHAGESYTPPVISYRRKHGVSVTGGYVYRGKKNSSFYGAYIFGDFESKRIWALTQSDRKLVKVRQIGSSPEKIASFGLASDGELFVVGYEGTIFRLVLDDSVFE